MCQLTVSTKSRITKYEHWNLLLQFQMSAVARSSWASEYVILLFHDKLINDEVCSPFRDSIIQLVCDEAFNIPQHYEAYYMFTAFQRDGKIHIGRINLRTYIVRAFER